MKTQNFLSTLAVLLLCSCRSSAPRLPSEDLFAHPDRAAQRFADLQISLAERQEEVAQKLERVRRLLRTRDADGLLLTKETLFSWITAGGESFIVHSSSDAFAKVLVTNNRLVLFSSNIESPRMRDEVVAGLGFTVMNYKYYQASDEAGLIALSCPEPSRILTDAANLGAMKPLATDDLFGLLYPLTAPELKRYRWLGHKCSEILETLADVVRPGMTEFDLQYLIAREFWYYDIFPTVNLASVDERLLQYKHPFPEGATLKKYANLNVCVRRFGLIISMSRLLHFGEPDAELARMYEVGADVMASMLHATRPGNRFADVLAANHAAFARGGDPDEWQRHLQGGPILTAERIVLLDQAPETVIREGMAFAYNPTCHGSKHEDTFLVTKDGLEMLTPCFRWPTRAMTIEGREYRVPDLKVVK